MPENVVQKDNDLLNPVMVDVNNNEDLPRNQYHLDGIILPENVIQKDNVLLNPVMVDDNNNPRKRTREDQETQQVNKYIKAEYHDIHFKLSL